MPMPKPDIEKDPTKREKTSVGAGLKKAIVDPLVDGAVQSAKDKFMSLSPTVKSGLMAAVAFGGVALLNTVMDKLGLNDNPEAQKIKEDAEKKERGEDPNVTAAKENALSTSEGMIDEIGNVANDFEESGEIQPATPEKKDADGSDFAIKDIDHKDSNRDKVAWLNNCPEVLEAFRMLNPALGLKSNSDVFDYFRKNHPDVSPVDHVNSKAANPRQSEIPLVSKDELTRDPPSGSSDVISELELPESVIGSGGQSVEDLRSSGEFNDLPLPDVESQLPSAGEPIGDQVPLSDSDFDTGRVPDPTSELDEAEEKALQEEIDRAAFPKLPEPPAPSTTEDSRSTKKDEESIAKLIRAANRNLKKGMSAASRRGLIKSGLGTLTQMADSIMGTNAGSGEYTGSILAPLAAGLSSSASASSARKAGNTLSQYNQDLQDILQTKILPDFKRRLLEAYPDDPGRAMTEYSRQVPRLMREFASMGRMAIAENRGMVMPRTLETSTWDQNRSRYNR